MVNAETAGQMGFSVSFFLLLPYSCEKGAITKFLIRGSLSRRILSRIGSLCG